MAFDADDEDAKKAESADDLNALGPETKGAPVIDDDAIDRSQLAKLSQGGERAGAVVRSQLRAPGQQAGSAARPPLSAAGAPRRLWLLPLVIGVGLGVTVSVLVISLPRGGGGARAEVSAPHAAPAALAAPVPEPLPPPPAPSAPPPPPSAAVAPAPSSPEPSAKPAPAPAPAPETASPAPKDTALHSAAKPTPSRPAPPPASTPLPPPSAAEAKPAPRTQTEEEKLAAAAVVHAGADTVMDAVLDDALGHPKDRNAEQRAAKALSTQELALAPSRDDVMKAMGLLVPAIRGCAQGKSGLATVTIVVRSDGHVESAALSGAPFAGTASGGCMEGVVRRAKFPRFKQASFRVQFPFAVQ